MLKKSNKITLEEATRLAILGKLPLKESTTVSTSGDGLTTVETDDANIVIEPKDNAAVDVGCPVDTTPVPVEEPIDETPIDEPVEDLPDDEPIMMEGKQVKKTEVKSNKVESKTKKEEGEAQLYKNKINKTDIKKVESKTKKEEGEAPLFKKVISKHDIKKIESKKVTEGEAPLFKTKINKTDIKKVEGKDCKDCGKEQKIVEDKLEEKEPKKHVINRVDLKKEEAIKKATAKVIEKKAQAKKTDFNEKLKTKVAEGLTKFVKEAYTNGKEVKVEKVIRLTENKVYVKGSLIMENSTKDFSCKLVPIKENKSFRKYTIEENKLLKITEGKTAKGKSFNLIVRK